MGSSLEVIAAGFPAFGGILIDWSEAYARG
jgi:hypothetical protein